MIGIEKLQSYNKVVEEQNKVLEEKYLMIEEKLRKELIDKQKREYEAKSQKIYKEKPKEVSTWIPLLTQLIEEQERQGKTNKEKQQREDGILPKDEIIKKYMGISYQKELKRIWDEELRKNKVWEMLAHEVIFFIDTIPDFVNQEIPDEILFGCDRRIWQLYIFCMFIYNKAKRTHAPISIYSIQKSIRNDFKMSLIDELVFRQDIDEYIDILCLNDVIHEYLIILEKYGYLEELPPGDKKYESWTVLDPSGV